MEDQPQGMAGENEEQVSGFATQVSGEQVTFSQGFAGGVAAKQDVSMTRAGAFGVAAGRDMELSYGGSFAMAIGHDAEISYGGAYIMSIGGTTEITNGGSLVMISKQVTAQRSFVGALISSQTTLEGDSRVLLNTPQAAAFGVVFGAAFALLSWALRRR